MSVKFSAIAAAATPALTDTFIGVQGGTTDVQYTGTQIQVLVLGKYILTQPATSATITIADGKTLTVSNTLTFAGTDSSTLNIGAGGTLGALAFITPGTGVATALGNSAGGAGGFALVGTTPPTGTAGGELAGTYPNPTLLNSAVIGKVLTGYASGAGTVAATDTILQAIQKLNGNAVAGPVGTAGGSLKGTYPNPGLADVSTIATSLAIGGATPGTDALAWTGTATGIGLLNVGGVNVTAATTVPNGINLSAANQLGFWSSSTNHWNLSGGGSFQASNTSGPRLINAAASATAPTFAPNRSDTTTGIGAQASGNISLIAGATERVRVATGAASVSDMLFPGTLFTGGTGTTTFPQMLFQPTGTTAVTTWLTTGTALGFNVAASTVNIIDAHVAGGTSIFKVDGTGTGTFASGLNANAAQIGSTITGFSLGSQATGTLGLGPNGLVGWGPTNVGSVDTILGRAGIATLRLGAADAVAPVAQTLGFQNVVAGTTDTAGANTTINLSRGTGTGIAGTLTINGAPHSTTGSTQNALSAALTINGDTLAATFGGNISGVAATFSGNIVTTGGSSQILNSGSYIFAGRSKLQSSADGLIELFNNAGSGFTRLNFGGTTSSFPALKRSTTTLQARLADDSAFAAVQGILTTSTAATTGLTAGVLAASTNASIVITDSTGQAYRIPCII